MKNTYNIKIKNFDKEAGFKKYMQSIYNYMGLSLIITGVVSYFAGTTPVLIELLYNSYAVIGIMILCLIHIFYISDSINRMKHHVALMHLYIYAVLNGLMLGVVFIMYTTSSIIQVFVLTSGIFFVMSMYGQITDADLTGIGQFAITGLIGLIIAGVFNLFFYSSHLDFILSIVGVIVFVMLIAYDTQKLKEIYYDNHDNTSTKNNIAILGALTLYLDFINLLLKLLRLLGKRRR